MSGQLTSQEIGKMAYQDDDDGWVLCNSIEDLDHFAQDGGWTDAAHFLSDTGYEWEVIKGRWFQVLRERVYFREDEAPN
jgi:hypothetical protein